jgi:hypothetical protein
MVPLIALMCVLEPVRYVSEKILSIKKHNIFLFLVFDLRFFTQIFILQQCLDPNPYPNPYPNPTFFRIRIQPKLSDSFGFGSTTLIRRIDGCYAADSNSADAVATLSS